MGGGNINGGASCRRAGGLSPRGRGKRRRRLHPASSARSIPAWAGETETKRLKNWRIGVYPRVGGGNGGISAVVRRARGLSPRGRGKPVVASMAGAPFGSIPAWAEETALCLRNRLDLWVYPRVGGGNRRGIPRAVLRRGLSPRGRGKQMAVHDIALIPRSIPAWAGET